MNYRIGHSRYESYQDFQKKYGKDVQTDDSTDYIDPIAGNKAVSAERARFVREYPYADMRRFKFEPKLTSNGDIGVVTWFVDTDGISSYDIRYDDFKKDKDFTAYLTSLRPHIDALEVTHVAALKKPASTGWPKIWDSSGAVYELQPLVFPAEPIYNERKFGIYRVRKDDDDYHINKFRPHVKLPYNFNNFRIYINENSYFMSNLPDAGVGWDEGPNLTNKDVRKVSFNTIPYTRMLSGAYIASYLSGVSLEHVKESNSIPKVITSIMRYHLYYTIRKLTVIKSAIDKLGVNLDVVKKHVPFKQVYLLNGETITAAAVPLSGSDYLSFIVDKSNGFTKLGAELLQESIESFVYAVLGAQANTRWSIEGSGAKALQTQRNFRKIVSDTILQSDPIVTITNMRTAVRDTNVILNTAISPGLVLFPSNFIILKNPIPGYNNILQTTKGSIKFGFNPKANYVGVKKDPPKKQHQGSTPIHHLDALGEHSTTSNLSNLKKQPSGKVIIHKATVPKKVTKSGTDHSSTVSGVVIGAAASFLLFKVVV
jgi:hypothetical protein